MSPVIALQHGMRMKERLLQLRAEFERGTREMALLDRRRQDLRDTLLRIKGAIQILEELSASHGADGESHVSNTASPDPARLVAS